MQGLSMRIHYISCHSVLEYDEVKLLTELGADVFSNGAYRDPRGAYTLPRPGIPGAIYHEDFSELSAIHPKTHLPPKLIDPFDVLLFMHSPDALLTNWPQIRHKRVIWRSIGQSTPGLEARLQPLVAEGLEIVRYSPKEKNLANYAGGKVLIRFYKDPSEFKDYTGENKLIVNFTQSLLGRRYFCHYDQIMQATEALPFKVYGPGNDDLGEFNGGDMPFEVMKQLMRESRALVYGGTWPACYTLSFIEGMMTGIPVVAIGRYLAEHIQGAEELAFYEISDIIQNGENGFISDDVSELHRYLEKLLNNRDLALEIGARGRKTATSLFGKKEIAKQWQELLNL